MPQNHRPPPIVAELQTRPEIHHLLQRTAEFLEQRRCWGQGHYEQETRSFSQRLLNRLRPTALRAKTPTRYCLAGAIYHTANQAGISPQIARYALMLVDWHVYASGCWNKPDAMGYNDASGRKLREVVAILRAAGAQAAYP